MYTGTSIVDYLKSIGQASDFTSRANLATQKGIQNYAGTAEQNLQLLNTLRGQTQTAQTVSPTQPPQATPGPVPQVQAPVVQQQTPQPVQQQIPTPQVQQTPQTQQTGQINPTTGQPTNMVQVTPEQYQQIQELSARANELLGTNIDVTPQVDETQAGTQEEAPKNTLSLFDEAMGGSTSGFDDLFKQFGISTNNSIEDVVKTLSQAYGMESINKEIEALDSQYADDVMSVNSNPWLSEGLRSKKIALLQDKYETKKNAYIDRLKLQGDIVGQALTLYENEKQLQKDLLFQAITERQNEIENQINIAKLNQAQGFELSAGQSRYEYNPDTGQYEVVASVAPAAKSTGGITDYQEMQAFIGISNKFQADNIVNQAIKGQTAIAIADQVIANPNSATNQLKSLYSLVKNLDPDSAVREGELALANQTQSYLQNFSNSLARITEGRVVSPDAAVQLAKATKELAIAWNNTAQRRIQQYQSQANVAGVGGQFSEYLGGSNIVSGTQNAPTVDSLPPTDSQENEDEGFWSSILSLFK